MKRILLSCLLAFGYEAMAQITLNEGFESTSSPAPGWTYSRFSRTTSAGFPCAGSASIRTNVYGTTYNTGNAVYSSTASNGTAVNVSFKYSARPFGTSSVVSGNFVAEYSIDGGATYTTIGNQVDITAAITTCTDFTGTIPAGAVPAGADFKFRVFVTSTNGGDWYYTLDDVMLIQEATTVPGCATIVSPAANATGVSVLPTFTWAAAPGATDYDIAVGTTAGGSDILPVTNVGNVTSYTLTNPLAYLTTYHLTVIPKNSFGTTTGCTSSSFTTRDILCPAVSSPVASTNGVSLTPTFTWAEVPNATSYIITMGTTAGGNDILDAVSLGNVLTYTYNGAIPLQSQTQYYYTITATDGTNTSTGCSERNFKTACATTLPPYTNDLSIINDDCWMNLSGGDITTGPTGSTKYWVADGFLNSGSTGSARINLYSTNRTGWYISPIFDLTGQDYTFTFDYGLTEFGTTAASAFGSDDKVQLLMSNDGGATWSVLQTWDVNTPVSNTTNQYSYSITGGTNQMRFAFLGSDGTVNDTEDYNFYIDNISITPSLSTRDVKENDEQVAVYPNPFVDMLYISDVKGLESMVVTDMAGRTVKTIVKPDAQVYLGDLKSGLYLVTLKYKDGTSKTVKSVKK